MAQINFRVSEEEKMIIQAFAKNKGITTSEFTKKTILKEISPGRVDLAFKLLKEGKLYRKKAWILSGLDYSEFMLEWTKRGAEELIPDEIDDYEIKIALELDASLFLK